MEEGDNTQDNSISILFQYYSLKQTNLFKLLAFFSIITEGVKDTQVSLCLILALKFLYLPALSPLSIPRSQMTKYRFFSRTFLHSNKPKKLSTDQLHKVIMFSSTLTSNTKVVFYSVFPQILQDK